MRATALALCVLLAASCATSDDDGTGSMTLALRTKVGGYFRLQIQSAKNFGESAIAAEFDTGCIDALSKTYELQNIPAGDGFVVFIESFGSNQCTPESRAEVGYRGGVDIPSKGETPYYHVPLFEVGTTTPFPENINLAAASAEWIEYCDDDSQCAQFSDKHVCYTEQAPEYWCLPTCDSDADCGTFHPDATCDMGTGWCRLASPYPLNLSVSRAFGHAAPLSDGSVVLIGGFTGVKDGLLVARSTHVDVFDAATGLFSKVTFKGKGYEGMALSGFAEIGPNRFVVVGGVRSGNMTWSGLGSDLELNRGKLNDADCTSGTCLSNMSRDLYVLDLDTGTAAWTEMKRANALGTVLSIGEGRVLVAGGYEPPSINASATDGPAATNKVFIYTIADDGSATVEEAGEMAAARAGAVAMCADESCGRALIIGGNEDGPVAEVITLGAQTRLEAQTLPLVPGTLWSPALCGGSLVGGSSGRGQVGGVSPQLIAPDGADWVNEYLESDSAVALPVFPAIAEDYNGDCWIVGGVTAGGATSNMIYRIAEEAVGSKTYETYAPRFGALTAAIGYGPLAGGILIAGGLQLAGSAELSGGTRLVTGAEILLP